MFCAYPTQSIFALFRRFGFSGCSAATDAVIQRFSARAAANASFLVRWICVFVPGEPMDAEAVSYTHLRAHETVLDLVCRLLLEKKK